MSTKFFQPITPQGHVRESFLYTESEALLLAQDGETFCESFSTALPVGSLLLNFWAKGEKVGNGYIMRRI
jgi:hypothetical protein